MTLVVHTPAADEPLDDSLVLDYCKVDDLNDPVIPLLIASARAHAETELHRYLVTQTVDLYLDEFPHDDRDCWLDTPILLPPIQSVTSITYTSLDGVQTVLAADQYLVDAKSQPARITPAWGLAWPATRRQTNAVQVRFVAGYGDPEDVPACIKNWMLVAIKSRWENRGALEVGRYMSLVTIPPSFIDSLLDSERVTGRI